MSDKHGYIFLQLSSLFMRKCKKLFFTLGSAQFHITNERNCNKNKLPTSPRSTCVHDFAIHSTAGFLRLRTSWSFLSTVESVVGPPARPRGRGRIAHSPDPSAPETYAAFLETLLCLVHCSIFCSSAYCGVEEGRESRKEYSRMKERAGYLWPRNFCC